jgi:hypothetical protein
MYLSGYRYQLVSDQILHKALRASRNLITWPAGVYIYHDKYIKDFGSLPFHFHCAGCYNLLLSSTIPIPPVQTYSTCHTELNPGKTNVPVQILKGFCRDYILGRKVISAKKFEIWTISQFQHHQRNHQYFFS